MKVRAFWLWVQSLGFWVFLAIVAAGAVALFIPLWHRQHTLQVENRRLEAEVGRLEAIEKQYRSEIEALKTDPTYLERVAREKLNLVKTNETVFQFPSNAVSRR
ncbi:MAG: septum formation initiator family protein [Verrucomicrobia bacterium]|nr:septum formation initiator family protein [Verrucomicrobiota bacterium]